MKNKNTLFIQMKKNPFLYKHFIKIKKMPINKGFSNFIISSIYSKIKKYSNLLKTNNFNAIEYTSFEKINDDIDKIIKNNQIKKFISRFLSNKYKHLLNEESEILFSSIYDMKISNEYLSNSFCKIASFKDSKDLNNLLLTILSSADQFSINYFIEKINRKKLNADIVEVDRENNTLLIRVNDYTASKELGSSHWCISRTPYFFNSYINKKGKFLLKSSQYFYYSFNLEHSNRLKMVGVTVSKGKFIFAADFFDTYLSSNHPICNKIINIHESYINDDFIVNHFIKKFTDSKSEYTFDRLELFSKFLDPLDLSSINIDTIINISLFFDNFSSKSMRKKSTTIFEKIILSKYSKSDIIDPDILSLLENKYSKILIKMNHLGFEIKTKNINNKFLKEILD